MAGRSYRFRISSRSWLFVPALIMLFGLIAEPSPLAARPLATVAAAPSTAGLLPLQTASNAQPQISSPVYPPGRASQMMAYDAATQTTLMFGGGTEVLFNDTWSWNGSGWTQLFPSVSPPPRGTGGMAYDPVTGTILLFGGCNAGGQFCGSSNLLGDTWSWNGSTWTQLFPATSPSARSYASMAFDTASNSVVLFGGQSCCAYLADTWSWTGTNWTQLSPAASPPGRSLATMTRNPSSTGLVLFGGYGCTNPPSCSVFGGLNDTWFWNGTTWAQVGASSCTNSCANSPSARWEVRMAYDSATNSVILFGGNPPSGPALGDTWSWSGTAWTQLAPAVSPSGRWSHSMAFDAARGRILLFGGYNGGNTLDDTWTWNGGAWTEISPVSSPSRRGLSAMAYDAATETILLFGGSAGGNETWSWDSSGWAQLSPPTSPPNRDGAAMAYDGASGTIVLFGGSGSCGVGCNDTWDWNGVTWTQLIASGCTNACTNSPPGRFEQSMAYDAVTQAVILFGGNTPGGCCLNDTWSLSYNSGTYSWTQLIANGASGSPAARDLASMAYDAATSTIVLFGGINNGNFFLGDTWSWNGSTWSQLSPATSPPARLGAATAYDAVTGTIVLFGGYQNSYPNDTWSWNGSTWTRLSPATSPLGREFASMAYDPTSSSAVLFGGESSANPYNDTWTWTGTTWIQACGTSTTPASPPCVLNVGPASGPDSGGAEVVLGGSGFNGATQVDFGAVPAGFYFVSDNLLVAFPPAGSAGSTIDITVTTPVGTSAISAGDQFTYVSAPIVSSVSPASVPATGGTSATISGSGFSDASGVTFGTVPAISMAVTGDGTITATSPPGAASATVDVRVSTIAGTSAVTSGDHFTYSGPPTVTGVSPSSGAAGGGTTVTINGTGFSTVPGQTTVQFGTAQAQIASPSSVGAQGLAPLPPDGAHCPAGREQRQRGLREPNAVLRDQPGRHGRRGRDRHGRRRDQRHQQHRPFQLSLGADDQ